MRTRAVAIGRGLSLGLVGGALVLPYAGGFPLAYVLLLLALALTAWWPFAARPTAPGRAEALMLGAFLVLAAAFLATGDVPSLIRFLVLLLAWPLTAALHTLAPRNGSALVGRLALAGVALALAIALWQVGGDRMVRARGFFSDEIWSAVAAMALGFIALVGFRATPGPWRFVFLAGPAMAGAVAALSGSRGPLLALPVILVAVAIFGVRRRMLAFGIAAAAVVALGVATAVLLPGTMARIGMLATAAQEVFSGAPVSETSADVRRTLLHAAWLAFGDEPWTGHGWTHLYAAVDPHMAFEPGIPPNVFHLHADPATFAVAAGIPGVVAWLMIVAAPLMGALDSPRDSQRRARLIGCAALSATYFSCGLANTLFGFEFHTVLFVVLSAILLGWCRDPAEAPR